jgi:hypothetical protein
MVERIAHPPEWCGNWHSPEDCVPSQKMAVVWADDGPSWGPCGEGREAENEGENDLALDRAPNRKSGPAD